MFTHKGKRSLNADERRARSTRSCLLRSSRRARRPVAIRWSDRSPPPGVLCRLFHLYHFPTQLHFSIATRLATHKPIVRGTISSSSHTQFDSFSVVLIFSKVIKSTAYRCCLNCEEPFLSLPPQTISLSPGHHTLLEPLLTPRCPQQRMRLSSLPKQGFRQLFFSPLNSTYLHEIPPAACHLETSLQHLR